MDNVMISYKFKRIWLTFYVISFGVNLNFIDIFNNFLLVSLNNKHFIFAIEMPFSTNNDTVTWIRNYLTWVSKQRCINAF